jgi:hypothetical protein
MNEKLRFSDETEADGRGLETDSRLFLYIYGKSLKEVFDLLIDPENTREISWEQSESSRGKWTGYNTLMSVSVEREGMISASLIRKN